MNNTTKPNPESIGSIHHDFEELGALLAEMGQDAALIEIVEQSAESIVACLRAGGKLMLAGNGASAGDAQHLACDFVSRFAYDRAPLAAISLSTDSSALTALGNDYGFEMVFARQIEALGKPGDCLLVLTTSGSSPNILKALAAARRLGITSIAMTGARGRALAKDVEYHLVVPSERAPRIQEAQIFLGHLICGVVEAAIHPKR